MFHSLEFFSSRETSHKEERRNTSKSKEVLCLNSHVPSSEIQKNVDGRFRIRERNKLSPFLNGMQFLQDAYKNIQFHSHDVSFSGILFFQRETSHKEERRNTSKSKEELLCLNSHVPSSEIQKNVDGRFRIRERNKLSPFLNGMQFLQDA
ncbi:hypothetical protein CDAR_390751 [Caerostris darwini]|uniref:Uncharacterized protein n=1 Tax=Caerostris darwini TaxID=1538125 RepID=A0AAV4U2M0_9ARAC|nr:hypothetical protein CDAR_390751 [Caerostris darwini]